MLCLVAAPGTAAPKVESTCVKADHSTRASDHPSSVLPAEATDLDLEALRGNVVLVDFWASWCAPCLDSFPWLSDLQNEFQDQGLVVIGVNEDRRRSEADAFLERHPPSFRVVFDPDGAFAQEFELKQMPSSFIFGRGGHRRIEHSGFRRSDVAGLRKEIQELLAEKATGES